MAESVSFGTKIVNCGKEYYAKAKDAAKKGYDSTSVFINNRIEEGKETQEAMTPEMKTAAGIFGISVLLAGVSDIARIFVKNGKLLKGLERTGILGSLVGAAAFLSLSIFTLKSNTNNNKELKSVKETLRNRESELMAEKSKQFDSEKLIEPVSEEELQKKYEEIGLLKLSLNNCKDRMEYLEQSNVQLRTLSDLYREVYEIESGKSKNKEGFQKEIKE